MRPCDSHEISQLNELKIDNNALHMIAGWVLNGDTIMVEQMPIFGGYAGRIEHTTICNVAAHLASFALLNGSYHLDGPIHVRWGITTSRETLACAGHTARAIDQNTNLLISNQYYPLAGPCTEMCLLETAAQAITDTASGRELVSGSASAKGVALDFTTGMEARMMGEAALAAAGMQIEKVNEILDNLIKKYEGNYKAAPKGKRFQECYDVVKVVPKKEYLEVYGKALDTLGGLGVEIR